MKKIGEKKVIGEINYSDNKITRLISFKTNKFPGQ